MTAGRAGLFSVTTSGSTGTPGRFLRSGREEAEFSARWRRVYAAWGCSAFDSQVNVAVASNRIKPPRAVFRTAELGVIAWSCPARRSLLHLNDDALAVEVVGPDGAPLPVGTLGELVVTSLSLTSMPLIRYRTGDVAARVPGPCDCGRGLGLLTRVQGRTAHAIRSPDGAWITAPVITNLYGGAQAYEWVRRFQVREEPGRRLRVLLEARRPPSEAQRQPLARTLRSGIGPHFQVALEMVDRIPMAPSGKLQFIVPLTQSATPRPSDPGEDGPIGKG